MKAPIFTAWVSSYNHERWVEKALRSILQQTVPVDRIIFYSDGSTDRTLEIAERVLKDDPRVEYLDSLDKNFGLMTRLIQVHDRIREGFTIGLSGDDTWDPRRVEIHRKHALSGVEWSVGTTLLCDESLRPTGRWDPVEMMEPYRAAGITAYDAILTHWPLLPLHGWAYSADLYHRVGGFDPEYCLEDFPMALKFAREAKPELTREIVGNYRVLGDSLSRGTTNFKVAFDWARISLAQARYSPLRALRAASGRFQLAGAIAAERGNRRDALRCYSYSAACWPSPLRVLRVARRRLLGAKPG